MAARVAAHPYRRHRHARSPRHDGPVRDPRKTVRARPASDTSGRETAAPRLRPRARMQVPPRSPTPALRSRATTATRRGSRSPRSPGGSDGPRPPSRRTSTTQRARRHERSRPAIGVSAGAAARRPARATGRVTPTPTASAAIPARSSGNGRANGSVMPCAPGMPATPAHPPPTTGRSRTRAGAGQRRSSGCSTENGRRRAQ